MIMMWNDWSSSNEFPPVQDTLTGVATTFTPILLLQSRFLINLVSPLQESLLNLVLVCLLYAVGATPQPDFDLVHSGLFLEQEVLTGIFAQAVDHGLLLHSHDAGCFTLLERYLQINT